VTFKRFHPGVLGHTDIRTTENYLDSFEKDVKKEFAGKLTAFKQLHNPILQSLSEKSKYH